MLGFVTLHGQSPQPSPATVETAEPLLTNVFKLSPGLFSRMIEETPELSAKTDAAPIARMDAREFFVLKGITFPVGSTATYIATGSRLIVRNTQANLDMIDTLVTPVFRKLADDADPFFKIRGDTPAEKADREWKNVVLIMEVYALPKADALATLESERGSAARYQRVLDLAKAKKARLEILTALTTKSGIRAITESLDEVRYPTEFQPGVAKGMPPAETTHETRNVGDTFEIEAVIGPDSRTCDLDLAPRRISLAGFREVVAAPGDSAVPQPFFNTQKITTSTSFEKDAPHYLGTFTPPSESGVSDGAGAEIWLAFLRVHFHGPAADEMKHPSQPADWSAMNLEYSAYSLDRAEARELLATMPSIEAPWEKLQALLGKKQARFEHLLTVKARSGQKSVTEETHEFRYVSEYASPGRTRSTEKTTRSTTTPANRRDGPETTTVERGTPNADGTPGAPISVETRNVGVTVECEPVVGPDEVSIELNHVLQSVAHLGNLKTGRAKPYLEQPLFQTRKITTSQTVLAGRHMLIGTFNPPGATGVNGRADDGRTWLVFVRALANEP